MISNIGSNWASIFVSAILALVIVPIILTQVGLDAFGVWALLTSGLAYAAIIDRAFGVAINRFVAYHIKDIPELNNVISASVVILIGIAALTVLGATVFSFFLCDIFNSIPPHLAYDARITCVLVGFTFAFRMLEANFSGALRGAQYYTRSNGITILGEILRIATVLLLLKYWKSIISIQIAYAVSGAFTVILMFIVTQKSIPGFQIRLFNISRKAVNDLFRYTIHSVAQSGSTVIMQNTLTLLIGWKGTAADVAIYNIASKLPNFLRGFLIGAQGVFLPAISSFHATGENEKIKSLLKKGTKYTCILTLIPAILLFFFSNELLTLWLKKSVPLETTLVMQLLILSTIPPCLFEIWLPALQGMGHLRGLTIRSVTTMVATIGLELLLLQNHVLPAMAPAISLVIVLWISTGIWLPSYGLGKTGITAGSYIKESLLLPLIAAVLSVMIVLGLQNFNATLKMNWMIVFAGSIIITALTFILIALRTEVQEFLKSFKQRRIAL